MLISSTPKTVVSLPKPHSHPVILNSGNSSRTDLDRQTFLTNPEEILSSTSRKIKGDSFNNTVNDTYKSAFHPVSTCEAKNQLPSNAKCKIASLPIQTFRISELETVPFSASTISRSSGILSNSLPPVLSRLPQAEKVFHKTSTYGSRALAEATSTPSSTDPCAEVETIVSNLGRGRGGHICLYCGKIYSRKYGLKIHIRTHTGYKPLSCRVCNRAFGDPSNLNKHVRLHAEGSTPYRCKYCGKILVRRRDLIRHLLSRHPDKPKPQTISIGDEYEMSTTDGEEEVEIEKLESDAHT